MALDSDKAARQAVSRVRFWYGLLLFIIAIFGLRLFYLQVIRYDHYKAKALSSQLKQYEIPATRGIITAHEGSVTVPIVLNQKLYTLYADPKFVKDPEKVALKLTSVTGGNANDYAAKMQRSSTRYVVLAKKLTKAQKQQITGFKYPGIGTVEVSYRTYPQGAMAAQLLGFVNSDGRGTYGIEQALNKQLAGTAGKLKAITDAHGVPLAASKDNVDQQPVNGENITLTLDLAIQQQVEKIIKQAKDTAKADSVSAIVMDTHNGAVKAMANYPTYDPANYGDVSDPSVFNNASVSQPIEIGSIMKPFTTAAALNSGSVRANQTYYDPSHFTVDGYTITNIEEDGGAGTKSLADVLNLSLNTGATWLLMQMSGGGKITEHGRQVWHDYMISHYLFGQKTGIEQGYEASGYIPNYKENNAGIDLTYANTAFGQAMTATPIQIAAALSSVVNGGTYYQPHLVGATTDGNGTTTATGQKVLKSGIVSASTSKTIVSLMEYVVKMHHFSRNFDQAHYTVGGKTGTAQIADPNGGYFDNLYNGTYMGFVGGATPQYVIVVFVTKPHVAGYAGTAAAQPIFADIAHTLIDTSFVTPKP